MPPGRQTSAGQQLEIARLSLQGVNLKSIADQVGVHHTTAKQYRQRLLTGLESIGIRPLCGCGRTIGHRGHCAADRKLPDDAPELTDEQLLDAMAGKLEPTAKELNPEERRRQFAEMVGRSRGWGESEESIRKRLGLSRLDLEEIKHSQTAAYNKGLQEGKARRFRARKAKPLAGATASRPEGSRSVRKDPDESGSDPLRRDSTTSVEIPTRLLRFIDQVVDCGIFGDTRTEVLAHLLQTQIGAMVKPGIVTLSGDSS